VAAGALAFKDDDVFSGGGGVEFAITRAREVAGV